MAVKGAVLGDILGSQYEFTRPKDLDWKHVELLRPEYAAFTDDAMIFWINKTSIIINVLNVQNNVHLL